MLGDGDGLALTLLFTALLIGGLVLLILVGIRALMGGISRPVPSQARRLLDERYARGELSTEEYREHVDNLGGQA